MRAIIPLSILAVVLIAGRPAESSDEIQNNGTLLAASFGANDFGGLGPCAGLPAIDGVPVVFDRPLDITSVDASDFVVVTSTGGRVRPACATFFPSVNADERQTILTQGAYGAPGASPRRVEIVGSIRSADRTVNYRGATTQVVPFEVGAILVYAQNLPLARQLGGPDQCPEGTAQVVQLAFGSNAGNTFAATPGYLSRFMVELQNGFVATPASFADTTVDNYLELCLNEASPAVMVRIDAFTIKDAAQQRNQVPLSAPVD